MSGTVLHADKVSRFFGGVVACQDVDLKVDEGSITSLIGPNGAGKTTLFNCITGIFPPSQGTVWFTPASGTRTALVGLRPDEIAASGIARTFQNIRLFQDLTVLQNVKLGEHAPTESDRLLDKLLHALGGLFKRFPWLSYAGFGAAFLVAVVATFASAQATLATWFLWFFGLTVAPMALFSLVIAVLGVLTGVLAVLPLGSTRREEHHIESASLAYLDFVGLLTDADELAENLAYGDQRRLEIARALACNPRLLLLDEPAAGMNPVETEALVQLIRRIRDAGVTVLLIEHDMKLVTKVSDYVYVLDHGELISQGPPETVVNDPTVIEAYLGREAVAGQKS